MELSGGDRLEDARSGARRRTLHRPLADGIAVLAVLVMDGKVAIATWTAGSVFGAMGTVGTRQSRKRRHLRQALEKATISRVSRVHARRPRGAPGHAQVLRKLRRGGGSGIDAQGRRVLGLRPSVARLAERAQFIVHQASCLLAASLAQTGCCRVDACRVPDPKIPRLSARVRASRLMPSVTSQSSTSSSLRKSVTHSYTLSIAMTHSRADYVADSPPRCQIRADDSWVQSLELPPGDLSAVTSQDIAGASAPAPPPSASSPRFGSQVFSERAVKTEPYMVDDSDVTTTSSATSSP